MKSRAATVILCAAALALIGVGVAHTADQLDAETKARIERFEKGPATVDISKYPQGIKDNYDVFAEKCTQCHKLSRPINSDYALPDEWDRYVKRMMHKPGSGITFSDGKKIYDFLVYDSSVRKKAMVQEHLDKLPPEDRDGAEKKIAKVRAQYDK